MNNDIRTMAKHKGISLWMIADKLNISEATMTRWMRKELDESKREQMISIINELSEDY